MPPPKFQGHVPAHRDAAQNHGLADRHRVQQGGQVVGVLLDGNAGGARRYAQAAAAKAAKIGGNRAEPPADLLDLGVPRRVVQGKGVNQHDGRPATALRVEQLDVAQFAPIS